MKHLSSIRRLTLLSATSLALAGTAIAQDTARTDDDLETIVVTAPNYVPVGTGVATKSDIPLVETPQSISVITRDQIDLLDWTNLGQTVRYVAGVNGENYGPDERVDWLTMRGFEPVQYIDGVQSSIGSIANTGLDLYGAQSVEILKGPSSALYGLTPPGGIVNVTSRRPDEEFGGEIEAQYGNRDHIQVNGTITGAITDTVSARLTALYRDHDTQTFGVNSDRLYVAPAITFQPGEATRFTLLSFYQEDEITGDGGGFLPSQGSLFGNPEGEISSTANLGELSYNRFYREHYGIGYDAEHAFNETFSVQQNLKYTHLDSDQRGIGGSGFVDADFDGTPDDYRTVNRYSFSFAEDVDTFGIDTRLNIDVVDDGVMEHNAFVGVDYRTYDYVGASAFSFAGIPTIDIFAPVYGHDIPLLAPVKFSDIKQKQTGVYVQDHISMGGLRFTASVRHDWVDTTDRMTGEERTDKDFSYRGGVSYVFENGFAPYVSYARSYQPTAGADRDGTPFEPTTGNQLEAGIKYDARGLPRGVKLFSTLSAYTLSQKNVLTPDPTNTGAEAFEVQTGEVQVKGVEFEVIGRFDERLSINASYTYTDSEVTESNGPELGAELPVTPTHKISALADYTLQDGTLAGLGASFGVRYLSESAGNLPSTFTPEVYTNPAVTLFDASVHYDLEDWRLSVSASNLFDKEYVARCYSASNCFFGTRRMVVASIARKF
ncbi:TonB-dependent siderophore receptor [Kordiimonas aestuarii]|uniref:TonB-dependent siderophore receptor n=1 Tax=Kordiimonas aestuarii TaxID=1005925 RepID=UPI0021CF1923|nr:TonB-dependent siderophore receptor [Kordiimonas aestuarii]